MHHSLQYYQDKVVLVTGAAGFLGSHLTDRLLAHGATVIGVDNFITGALTNLADHWDAATNTAKTAQFRFIEADVNQPVIQYLPAGTEIDCIFHFASPASPPRYQEHPVETYLVNSWGTHQLLDYLRHHNPQGRLIFAGTSEAYGDPAVHPQVETYWGNVNPNGPRSCYDESKRLGESICGVHTRDFDIDTRIVRIFNTYGPRMDLYDGRVIPNLILYALQNKPMTIYGDGTQTRSYCYVDDLVEGILRLGGSEQTRGETVNIGNPDEFTILETAEVIHKALGNAGELNITFGNLPKDDPTKRQPDITKAKLLLDWRPEVSFRKGLRPTISYFRKLGEL